MRSFIELVAKNYRLTIFLIASNNSEYFDCRMAEILGIHDIAALYHIRDFFLFILFAIFYI